jgi:hypothetical protein
MPAGNAQIATSVTSSCEPPWRSQRRAVIAIAASSPMMYISP